MDFSENITELLLLDRTCGRNILWATDEYRHLGEGYGPECEIELWQVAGLNADTVRPRAEKTRRSQSKRTRTRAEVYTPQWICAEQNSLIDDRMLGLEGAFNNGAVPDFGGKTTWQAYVKALRLETACGEAPYLTSGGGLDFSLRMGMLDRKLRTVNHYAEDGQWFGWVKKAFCSIYGFELSGDSLLLARLNLLNAFADAVYDRFGREPTEKELKSIAAIITHNLWQMDALTCMPPYTSTPCKIRRWSDSKQLEYRSLTGGSRALRLNAVVGNPPFQLMDGGAKASAMPIYDLFMKQAKGLRPDFISLIMPARWYAGRYGHMDFREEMIHDRHIRRLIDYPDASQCFSGLEIRSGVCCLLWVRAERGPCRIERREGGEVSRTVRYLAAKNEHTYVRYFELTSVKDKVLAKSRRFVSSIVSVMRPYGIRGDFFKDPAKYGLPPISKTPIEGGYRLLGLNGAKREYRYLPADYPIPRREMLDSIKVFIARNYGFGELNDVMSEPYPACENELCTETFVQAGPFEDRKQAQRFIKYTKTRFFRAMVSLCKQDQGAPRTVYAYVPLESFMDNSDIDFEAPLDEIDAQLFKKYGLSEGEADFINRRIRSCNDK